MQMLPCSEQGLTYWFDEGENYVNHCHQISQLSTCGRLWNNVLIIKRTMKGISLPWSFETALLRLSVNFLFNLSSICILGYVINGWICQLTLCIWTCSLLHIQRLSKHTWAGEANMLSYLSSSPLASGLSSDSLKISNLLVKVRETSILLVWDRLDSDPGSADEDSPVE